MTIKKFTFTELALTLSFCAILGGCIIKIVMGPIQSYFFANFHAGKVESGAQSLEYMKNELRFALPSSIKVEKTAKGEQIHFRKILHKALITSNQGSIIFPQSLLSTKQLIINFPTLTDHQDRFYEVKLKNEQHQGKIKVGNILSPIDLTPGLPFYIVTEPISYAWSQQDQRLERFVNNDKSIIADHIVGCQFILTKDKPYARILISLSLSSPKDSMLMLEPLTLQEQI